MNMQQLLDENLKAGKLRTIVAKSQHQSKIIVDNKEYINLSSNDYLGLASNLNLAKEFLDSVSGPYIRQSSSGSPLLTGAHESYLEATEVMESLFNKSALFFTSGFAANSGLIGALATKENLIIADKLAHASIINGIKGAEGKCLRYAHNDYEHLQRLIEANHEKYDSIIIVTEAVFSMDGDKCDLNALVALKKRYDNVYIYVDEAHSFCLYNDNGAGFCASENKLSDIDFILTTFGKGLGSQGACLLSNKVAHDYFINTTRSLIFSTALSPFTFAHNAFMLKYMQKAQALRDRLYRISDFIHETLIECGYENVSSSQIIPFITGDNDKAIKAFAFFRDNGFYAMPIRHPTVPLGKARLRLSLTASLTDSEVEKLAKTIKAFRI